MLVWCLVRVSCSTFMVSVEKLRITYHLSLTYLYPYFSGFIFLIYRYKDGCYWYLCVLSHQLNAQGNLPCGRRTCSWGPLRLCRSVRKVRRPRSLLCLLVGHAGCIPGIGSGCGWCRSPASVPRMALRNPELDTETRSNRGLAEC